MPATPPLTPLALALLALTFGATFALVVTAAAFLDRRRLGAARAARARLRAAASGADGAASEAVRLLRGAERLSGFKVLHRLLQNRRLAERLALMLRAAGVAHTVGELVQAFVVCAALGALLGASVGGLGAIVVCAPLGGAVPWLVLRTMAARRRAAFDALLPEMVDTLVSALKAGYSFPAALEFAAGETPAPLGPELARARDEQRLGMDSRAALSGLAERVDTADMRMLVTCVLVQRETGGNLAQLLTDLAGMVRERAAFRGRVAALTAEPRMSALLLASLPALFFVVLMVLSPNYVRPLLTLPIGRLMLGVAVLASGTGYVVMRRIGAVEL